MLTSNKKEKYQSRFQRIFVLKQLERIEQQDFSLDIKTFIFNEDPGISKYPCASSDNPLIQGKFALS